jgi:hypothetical protein
MVERPNIFWQIYAPLMIFIFCLMQILATTKRIIEKIKECKKQNVNNMIQFIKINPEGPELLSGGLWSFKRAGT